MKKTTLEPNRSVTKKSSCNRPEKKASAYLKGEKKEKLKDTEEPISFLFSVSV